MQALKIIEAGNNNAKHKAECVARALDLCVSKGLVHVQSNDGDDFWPVYEELHREGKLPIRVSLTPHCSEIMSGLRTGDDAYALSIAHIWI